MTDVYTLGEASRFLGRSIEFVMKLIETGQLPCTQTGDGEPFISGRDLTRLAIATFGKPR